MRRTPILALTLLLAACSTNTTPQPTPAASVGAAPDTILTVPVSANTSDAELVSRYGGFVALKTSTFAIMGNPGQHTLQAQGHNARKPQPNKGVMRAPESVRVQGSGFAGLWGSGFAGLWGSGFAGLWGSGFAGLWGSGQFTGLPANTQSWLQIGLDVAHANMTNPGNSITVAVVDSGLDLAHPMFTSRLAPESTWKDFVDGDANPQEEGTPGQGEYGHGTEVAGITVQIAPGVQIMPLRVLDEQGGGDVLNVASAIVWAADHGANVINLSLGTGEAVDALTQAVAYANSKNVLVVASAGNSNQSQIDYPAAEMGGSALSVAVGSVNCSDIKSAFSSYSAAVGLMAPGEGIAGPFPGELGAAWSGTSMSAPVVAGALALGLGEGKTPQNALSDLKSSAANVDSLADNVVYAGKLGAGRINLAAYMGKN